MQKAIEQYFQRYTNQLSQSVFAAKGLEDYSKLKRFSDYLDYDQQTLFRDKKKTPCGLNNIGNTCYLNAILQILYNINYLRDKVLNSENHQSKFLEHLKLLFGKMCIGTFVYADPTDFFQYLKETHPNVFVSGVQNDFHQIFTLLLDQFSQCFKQSSPDDSNKFLRKLLFGKLSVNFDFGQDKLVKNNQFNIINLEVSHSTMEAALNAWRKTTIDDFLTPKGNKVKAQVQNNFLETPALLTFLINRVSYKNYQLQKDNRVFQFEDTISIEKTQKSNDKQKLSKSIMDKEKKYFDQKILLEKWIEKVEKEKMKLIQTLEYFEKKQEPQNIDEPTIINPHGQKSFISTIQVLKSEISEIEKKVINTALEIKEIEKKMEKIGEEGNFETYNLWAVMIHEGTTANSGHYKLCIKFDQDKWIQYNDRTVTTIDGAKIKNYKQKGEISSLFYKRGSLICDPSNQTISSNLKSIIKGEEKELKMQIDKARLLQCLYQESESANILLEYEFHYGIKEAFSFYFRPVHYAINEKYPIDVYKGIITFGLINNQTFKNNFQKKLLTQGSQLILPNLQFGVPQEYYLMAANIRDFLQKQSSLYKVAEAYQELAQKKIKFTKRICRENFIRIVEIFILKGLFYLNLFSQHYLGAYASKLSSSLDQLLEMLDSSSEFVLVCISIKESIKMGEGKKAENVKELNMSSTRSIRNHYEYFSESFKYWMEERKNLQKLDEQSFTLNRKLFKSYEVQ